MAQNVISSGKVKPSAPNTDPTKSTKRFKMDDQETIDRLVKSCIEHRQFQEKSPRLGNVYCALHPEEVGIKGVVNCPYINPNMVYGVKERITLKGCDRNESGD